MEYRKVGRGGAGNYYSQDDVAKASKLKEDVEAQHTTTEASPEEIAKARSEYAHSGRGGAGNYSYGTRIEEAQALKTGETPSVQDSNPSHTGYHGRGGAGNYQSGDAEKAEARRRASIAQEKKHPQVIQDVEAGLRQPEKVHLGSEKLE
ncbi:hypothetical protein ACLMJK_008879 [Lecanora helva]